MNATIKRLAKILVTTSILGVTALYLYTLPALRRLPKDKERSLNGITTIDDAVRYLRRTGKTGWDLVAAAQKLVNAKMEYSRRNGWDTPSRAFRRGMGYCQQQGSALLIILRRLGVEARPVQAFRCRFPAKHMHEYCDPGGVSGHMWLVVTIDGVEKDVCPGHPENEPGKVHFEILSRKTAYGPVMRCLGHIGSMILNVQRDNAALQRQAAHRLRRAGCQLVAPAESFFMQRDAPPRGEKRRHDLEQLEPGEVERASHWARELMARDERQR